MEAVVLSENFFRYSGNNCLAGICTTFPCASTTTTLRSCNAFSTNILCCASARPASTFFRKISISLSLIILYYFKFNLIFNFCRNAISAKGYSCAIVLVIVIKHPYINLIHINLKKILYASLVTPFNHRFRDVMSSTCNPFSHTLFRHLGIFQPKEQQMDNIPSFVRSSHKVDIRPRCQSCLYRE